MKKNTLKWITLVCLLVSFLFTGGVFAYWASSVAGDEDDENPQISIGVGETIETTIFLAEAERTSGVLVPAGFESSGHVSEIVITYEITLSADEGAEGAEATLSVEYGTLPHQLLNVSLTPASQTIIADGDAVLVNVSITITEPNNAIEYAEVAGQNFSIQLTFHAVI